MNKNYLFHILLGPKFASDHWAETGMSPSKLLSSGIDWALQMCWLLLTPKSPDSFVHSCSHHAKSSNVWDSQSFFWACTNEIEWVPVYIVWSLHMISLAPQHTEMDWAQTPGHHHQNWHEVQESHEWNIMSKQMETYLCSNRERSRAPWGSWTLALLHNFQLQMAD